MIRVVDALLARLGTETLQPVSVLARYVCATFVTISKKETGIIYAD